VSVLFSVSVSCLSVSESVSVSDPLRLGARMSVLCALQYVAQCVAVRCSVLQLQCVMRVAVSLCLHEPLYL